jgi:RimJ/RimL family protein N-acetyltransferase
MMLDVAALAAPMQDGGVQVRRLVETDREALRAACTADPHIWDIYPYSMLGAHFDPAFERLLSVPNRMAFALLHDDALAGTSSYFIDAANAVVEIGGTYIAPTFRGGPFNRANKRLMIDRAFGSGAAVVQLKVDVRNGRSRRAVEKLGAKLDGILRGDRVTWTGHRRSTAVYSLLPEEWALLRHA